MWGTEMMNVMSRIMSMHQGKGNEITARALTGKLKNELVGFIANGEDGTNKTTRRIIRLFMENSSIPVASNRKGYYLINTEAEFNEYQTDLYNRIAGIRRRVKIVSEAWAYNERSGTREQVMHLSDIINDYNEGMNMHEIKQKYKFSNTADIRKFLYHYRTLGYKINKRNRGNILSDQEIEEVLTMYRNCTSMKHIAELFYISKATIYRYIRMHDAIEPASTHGNEKSKLLQKLWNDGLPIWEIADRTGYSTPTTVSRMVTYYRQKGMDFKRRKDEAV
jgi:transposase